MAQSNETLYAQINQLHDLNTKVMKDCFKFFMTNLVTIEAIENQIIANSPNIEIIDGQFFQKESLLGRGGCGKVYKCKRRCSGQIVAVKEVKKGKACFNEGRIMMGLSRDQENWPYFVRLYNEFENITAHYLVMEYCSGRTLEKFVKQNGGELPRKECKSYFAHLVEGVKKLHSLDYIHRDLKPSNILVNELSNGENCLKISDFGLTIFEDSIFLLPINLKESPYRAPELIAGFEYDKSVDVYSLGAIYFFMLNGKDPRYQFDKCGYPINDRTDSKDKRHGIIGNRMMCRRADERLELEELKFRKGKFSLQTRYHCDVCGRKLSRELEF